ncbi:hypothetical protein CDL15_Pgr008532 [Punica granatum]|uniref:Uncharacterized protein n=1 Tax=Punica granatum TaxID=22663 RepID=A0A218WP02_PUNGR|nr:hypothetical protein CDL15_Pgr008532 [Punica granatum]
MEPLAGQMSTGITSDWIHYSSFSSSLSTVHHLLPIDLSFALFISIPQQSPKCVEEKGSFQSQEVKGSQISEFLLPLRRLRCSRQEVARRSRQDKSMLGTRAALVGGRGGRRRGQGRGGSCRVERDGGSCADEQWRERRKTMNSELEEKKGVGQN